jgi:spore maturation protein CgeB
MEFVFFVHSLLSDWNHGNAHFLRGIVSELKARKHTVFVYEPRYSWSRMNLIYNQGECAVQSFNNYYPGMKSELYDLEVLDLCEVLDNADVVIVHEWNDPELVMRIGEHRKVHNDYKLFFHDTHHRTVTDPQSMSLYDLSCYDGVLAFGEVIRSFYREHDLANRAWTWHEAADVRIFKPINNSDDTVMGDLVWIGNWGDEERSNELRSFLFKPVKYLHLKSMAFGVRYPADACELCLESGIKYAGWIPNYIVPLVFSKFRVTLHIPRRPYVHSLPGIPTIRVFEALACGIPLICSPWFDSEDLFQSDKDFLIGKDTKDMIEKIRLIINNDKFASDLSKHGRETILKKHTCAHRVDQLFEILHELGVICEKSNTIENS